VFNIVTDCCRGTTRWRATKGIASLGAIITIIDAFSVAVTDISELLEVLFLSLVDAAILLHVSELILIIGSKADATEVGQLTWLVFEREGRMTIEVKDVCECMRSMSGPYEMKNNR
jgi:hypothetical protein